MHDGLHQQPLGVDGGSAGLAFGLLAALFVQRVMDAIQHAIDALVAKITIDGAAQRQILGKITPLASSAQHVHHRVERLSHVCFALAASPPRGRNERFDMRPLLIRQVTRIPQMITRSRLYFARFSFVHIGASEGNHNRYMGLNNFRDGPEASSSHSPGQKSLQQCMIAARSQVFLSPTPLLRELAQALAARY